MDKKIILEGKRSIQFITWMETRSIFMQALVITGLCLFGVLCLGLMLFLAYYFLGPIGLGGLAAILVLYGVVLFNIQKGEDA